jgi:hypothetical protein
MLTRRTTARKGSARKYSRSAGKSVERAMRRRKHGTLSRGKAGHGGKVKSRKQAIAIGLSEARKKGAKVPPPPAGSASARRSRRGAKRGRRDRV